MPLRTFRLGLAATLLASAALCHADDTLFTFSQSMVDPDSGRSTTVTGVCRAAVDSSGDSLAAARSALPGIVTAVPLNCGLISSPLGFAVDGRSGTSVWNVGGSLVSVTPPPQAIYQAINTKPVYVVECNEDGSYCETTYRCREDPVGKQSICEPV